MDGKRQTTHHTQTMTYQWSMGDTQPIHELAYQVNEILKGITFLFLTQFTKPLENEHKGAIGSALINNGFLPKAPTNHAARLPVFPQINFIMNNIRSGLMDDMAIARI